MRLSMRLGAVIPVLLLVAACGRDAVIRGVAPEGTPQPVEAVNRRQPAARVTVQGKIIEK